MSAKYQIGGSATINGVIMINTARGKVSRAARGIDGTISVKELPLANKAMRFYRSGIEKPFSKIPVLREIFKILLMFFIVVTSYMTGIAEALSFKKRWSIRRIISVVLILAGLYVFIFLDDLYSIAMLILLILYFHKKIALMLRYHGAEHKCINMYENVNDLSGMSVELAQSFPRTHGRCGTNIIFIMIPLSIIYYLVVEQGLALMTAGNAADFIGSVVLLGISIELFRLFQKPLMRWILKPGILLQKYVTTKEPDKSQLEVAIKALEAVM